MTPKSILFLIPILCCFNGYSQSITPDSFPINGKQAKEAIRNAQRVDNLLLEVSIQNEIIVVQKAIITSLEESVEGLSQQLSLSKANFETMKSLYEAEKEKRNPGYSFKSFLKDVQLVGLGIIVGVLAVVL